MIRIPSTSSASGSLRQVLIGQAMPLQCTSPHLARLLHPQKLIDQTGVRSPWRVPSTVTNYQRSPTIVRRALPHQGTRRTDTKHQQCCATITQILPPTPPQPHKRAHSAQASSVEWPGTGHSPGKYSSTIPSNWARISRKGQSRSSVVALMRLPLMR